MLEGNDLKCVDMVFPFVTAFVDRVLCMENEGSLTRISSTYSDIMVSVLFDQPRLGWTPEEMAKLSTTVQEWKKLVVEFFGAYCETGLFTLKFHMLDHMVTDIRKFGTLSVLSASQFEHFNTDIKKAVRQTSQRVSTRMDETVIAISNQYVLDNAPAHGGLTQNSTYRSVPEQSSKRSGNYLVREGTTISLSTLLAAHTRGNVSTIPLSSSRADVAMTIFSLLGSDSTDTFLRLLDEYVLVHHSTYDSENVSLTFVQSGFVMGGFVPTLDDYCQGTNTISPHRLETYGMHAQRVFASKAFGPSKKELHSFVLLKGENGTEPVVWVARILALFHISTYGWKHECAFVQYMQSTQPIDAVDRELKCLCLRWATEDEIDHTLSDVPDDGQPVEVGKWFGIEHVDSIMGSVHVVRSNFTVHPFTPEIPWSHHRFYVNRFYRNIND